MRQTHLEAAVATIKSDGLCVLAGRVEDDGGEALHLDIGVLVLSAVHLGNDHGVNLHV